MEQNKNNAFTSVVKDAIDSRFDSENNFIFFYTNDINNDGWTRGWVGVIAKNNQNAPYFYGEINNNGYQWSAYSLFNTTIACYKVNANRTTGQLGVTNLGNNQAVFNNMISNVYSSNCDYISNFQVMTNNMESARVVLFYDDGVSFPDDDTARQDMAKPDANDYFPNWTNKPTFDDSSVEKALSSLFDIVDWGWNNIKGTIQGLGEFLTDSMRWGMQKIIDTIRNKIDELKTGLINKLNDIWDKIVDVGDALVDLGDTLTDVYDFFADPWDDSDFDYTLQHSDFYAIYTSIGDSLDSINDTFDSVNEPESFVIRYSTGFHPDNELGFHFPTIEGEISFDWLIPLRIYYRPILWLVVVYEMVVYGFSTFGDVLQGRTGEK